MSAQKYAVLIGTGEYDPNETKLPRLRCPPQDVAGLAELLESDTHGPYKVKRLVNVSHSDALDAIYDVLMGQAGPDDLVLLYYSGHGKPDTNGDLYLATTNTQSYRLPVSSIPLDTIGRWMRASKSRKIILILDCCYSGAVERLFTRGEVADNVTQALPKQLTGCGTYVLTASTDVQLAEEKEGDTYGLLTKHIISGIRDGEADRDDDGVVSMNELLTYVQKNVPAEGFQSPQGFALRVEGGELAIAKTGKAPKEERRTQVIRAIFSAAANQPVPPLIVNAVLEAIDPASDLSLGSEGRCDERLEQLYRRRADPHAFLATMFELASDEVIKKKLRQSGSAPEIKDVRLRLNNTEPPVDSEREGAPNEGNQKPAPKVPVKREGGDPPLVNDSRGPRRCPKCYLLNPPTAQRCDCGHEFPPVALEFPPVVPGNSDLFKSFSAPKRQSRWFRWMDR